MLLGARVSSKSALCSGMQCAFVHVPHCTTKQTCCQVQLARVHATKLNLHLH